jgi:drug/metabolite transporter (DMT)-like permease
MPLHCVVMLSNQRAIAALLILAVAFGANHVCARLAFDHGTGIVVAVAARASLCALALGVVALLRKRPSAPLDAGMYKWLVIAGLCVAAQSGLIYTAVSKIPVALALLVFNLFALFFVLLTWRSTRVAPPRRTLAAIPVLLVGLAVALQVPVFSSAVSWDGAMRVGVLCALLAALVFSVAMWISDRKLSAFDGVLRTLSLQLIVCVLAWGVVASNVAPALSTWPRDGAGRWALLGLALFYGSAFCCLFIFMPRLNMARNAPALNFEPIATLGLAWVVLGQKLNATQLVGAAAVVCAVILLGRR